MLFSETNQGEALHIIRYLLRHIINGFAVVYHQVAEVYSLWLMIYAFGNDIHAYA